MTATTGNESVSDTFNDFGVTAANGYTGMVGGFPNGTNKVNGSAEAWIGITAVTTTVTAGGGVAVEALDRVSLVATSTIVAESTSAPRSRSRGSPEADDHSAPAVRDSHTRTAPRSADPTRAFPLPPDCPSGRRNHGGARRVFQQPANQSRSASSW